MCDAESCAAVQSLVLELEEVLFFLLVSFAVILSSQIFSSTFFAIFARHNPCKVKVLPCYPAYLHTESTIQSPHTQALRLPTKLANASGTLVVAVLQMSRTVLLQHVSGKAAFVHMVFGLKQFIGKIGARTYQPVRARFISNFLPLHSRFLCSTNMRKCRVLLVRIGFKSCRNVNAHKPNLDHSDNFA